MCTDNELLGIPDNPPDTTATVSDADDLFASNETAAEQELDEALAAASWGSRWFCRVQRTFGSGSMLVLLVCAILLFLLSQSISLASQLASLPPFARHLGTALLLGLIGGVGWALLRLVRVFSRLRVTPRLPVETLRQLSERAELRQQANARLHQARQSLQRFLKDYPLAEEAATMHVLGRVMESAELTAFKDNARGLMDMTHGTSEGWVERFERQFLARLDVVARRRIRSYAARVALKTAALPAGFDTAVILLNAYLMARDMCVIYNLRTNGPGTAAVLVRVLFNAFAASQMQDMTAASADMFFEGGGALAGVARTVAARAAEGSVNALLFHRLGAAMVRHLRPIWPPQRA